MKLSHGQTGVFGRRWITEIGLRQDSNGDNVECSVLLRTEDVSAQVVASIQVTRPKIVQLLLETCSPIGSTPGLAVKQLTEENASAFAYEIEHEERKYPLVLVSCAQDGKPLIQPERLRALLMGLAQVIEIPGSTNTYRIQHVLGRRYSAFGGAVNVIFPARRGDTGLFCRTSLLLPNRIKELQETAASPESEVLATVTHQTNLPNSWRHVSIESVDQAILRHRLRKAAAAAKGSDEVAAYEELLEEAAALQGAKDGQLSEARNQIEAHEATIDQLRASIDGLRHALSGSQAKASVDVDTVAGELAPLRELVVAVLDGEPQLEQALRLAAALYSNRIVVLDTAYEAARESDRAGFRYGEKAFEMLRKLADDYWQAIADGQGDQQAKSVFGQNGFAAKEAETLSTDGRRRRTFKYLGREILMEKHLKHGVKDSAAETLRIHFEWLAEEKLLIVGHCGKHLNF